MDNRTDTLEKVSAERFDAISFLKEIDLDTDTKRKLLACISVMMAESANHATRIAVASCLGLNTEDPKFASFWNNDLAPIITLNPDNLFKDLRKDILNEKDGENSCITVKSNNQSR